MRVEEHRWRNRIEGIVQQNQSPGALRPLLATVAAIYGGIMTVRNQLYDHSLLGATKVGVPIISVGGITVGGVGKTPFVIALAQLLINQGIRPGILSRGYGVTIEGGILTLSDGHGQRCDPPPFAPDEPYLMACALPAVPVVAAPDRTAGARALSSQFALDVILLDDGFQRRSLHRDLDILLLDSNAPFGNGRLFPRGPLRESVSQGLRRADCIGFIGKAPDEQMRASLVTDLVTKVEKPWFVLEGSLSGYTSLDQLPVGKPSEPVLVVTGIARPERVMASLEVEGVTVAAVATFADHHQFTAADMDSIIEAADVAGARTILTTEKDRVRLAPLAHRLSAYRTLVARYELRFSAGESTLLQSLAPVVG